MPVPLPDTATSSVWLHRAPIESSHASCRDSTLPVGFARHRHARGRDERREVGWAAVAAALHGVWQQTVTGLSGVGAPRTSLVDAAQVAPPFVHCSARVSRMAEQPPVPTLLCVSSPGIVT